MKKRLIVFFSKGETRGEFFLSSSFPFPLPPSPNLLTHRERPDAKPLRQDPLLHGVDRRDANRDARVRVVREVVVEVVFVEASCTLSAFVVTKLVAARAVGDGLALLPGGLAAGLVGEAFRQDLPGGLELAAVGAPRSLLR